MIEIEIDKVVFWLHGECYPSEPGCPADIEIDSVTSPNTLTEIIDLFDLWKPLREKALEKLREENL